MVMTRRGFLGVGAGVCLTAMTESSARAEPHRGAPERGGACDDSWTLPAHDLEATRSGSRRFGTTSRWRRHLVGGVPGAAAIVGERVFAASFGGAVAAFARRTGAERWRRELGTASYGSGQDARELGFFGGVAVAAGRVLVASDRLFGLDAASGRTLFASRPLRTASTDDYFWGPPVVASGLVLIGSGSGAELPTAQGRLSAYSLDDGSLEWSTPMVPRGANGGGVIGAASVDLVRGVAYVVTGSPYVPVAGDNPGTSSLVELRLRDGRISWSDQVYAADARGFDFNSAPVIVGRLLVAANKDGFYAWDRFTRRRLWHRRLTPSITPGNTAAGPVDGPENGPIATDGERIYVLSNDGAAGTCVVAALDPASGNVCWQRTLPSYSFSPPAVADGRLCAVTADGALWVLDAETGADVSTLALGEATSGAPVIAEGNLVVGTGAAPFLPGDSLVCFG